MSPSSLRSFILIGWVVPMFGVPTAWAATRHVPSQYETIRQAVDACTEGDIVLIAPGTYTGEGNRDVELPEFDIAIVSESGPDVTIIDCEEAGRAFMIPWTESRTRSTLIGGLTIRNGRVPPGDYGGAIFCDGTATIQNCRILENSASSGAGILFTVTSALVEDCTISGNRASLEGGGIQSYVGPLEIRRCLISGNHAATEGGGIAVNGHGFGAVRLDQCTITRNTCSWGGGGYWGGDVRITNSVVWGNCAGGGANEVKTFISAEIECSAVDSSEVHGEIDYSDCVFSDPLFCAPVPCGYIGGDWTLHADSPCLAENSPCGQLIGLFGHGCGVPGPTGACCLSDGSCILDTESRCVDQGGTYLGNGSDCDPDPCGPTAVEGTTWGRIKLSYR